VGAGPFEKRHGDQVQLSGFSETVDWGTVGVPKLDERVVMRVECPEHEGPLAERAYFRGMAYDIYDGRAWSNTFNRHPVVIRCQKGRFCSPWHR
jgi:hypothetical protein